VSVLREWAAGDGEWYAGAVAEAEIERFTSDGAHVTAAVFRAALGRLSADPDWAGWAIVDPETGELAGNIAATRNPDGTAELSYWLAAGARGRGLATRALAELCVRLGERWPGCRPELWTHAANTASQRVAERAGFVHQPDRDERRGLGGVDVPARWYARGGSAT
jgi:[ribosomal protein S5]-alanine N-acetyltransferase